MLNPHINPTCLRISRSSVLQDLAVLTTEIEKGTIAKAGEANYALLTKAAQTIHRFLDLTLSDEMSSQPSMAPQLPPRLEDEVTWEQQLGQDFLESELSFWQGIADHPSLFSQCPLADGEELDGHHPPESQQP